MTSAPPLWFCPLCTQYVYSWAVGEEGGIPGLQVQPLVGFHVPAFITDVQRGWESALAWDTAPQATPSSSVCFPSGPMPCPVWYRIRPGFVFYTFQNQVCGFTNCSDVSTSQGMPRMARSHQKLEGKQETDSPSEGTTGLTPWCWTSDLQPGEDQLLTGTPLGLWYIVGTASGRCTHFSPAQCFWCPGSQSPLSRGLSFPEIPPEGH